MIEWYILLIIFVYGLWKLKKVKPWEISRRARRAEKLRKEFRRRINLVEQHEKRVS